VLLICAAERANKLAQVPPQSVSQAAFRQDAGMKRNAENNEAESMACAVENRDGAIPLDRAILRLDSFPRTRRAR